VISWFSCGAASAVATRFTIEKYPDCIPVYCDTSSEHPDNKRFIADCEAWFQRPIKILHSKKYADIWAVFESGYLVGPKGAKCTTELKKLVRREFEQLDDIQVFGFTSEEKHRADRFREHNPEVTCEFTLIDKNLSKQDCFDVVQKAGIELPAMYRMGFHNNNCLGCVKGGEKYWGKIKREFPEVFERMAKLERKLGHTILKHRSGPKINERLYLDELDTTKKGRFKDLEIQCGLFCGEI
jgi:hypothetical protein